jgi:hypothetical protein
VSKKIVSRYVPLFPLCCFHISWQKEYLYIVSCLSHLINLDNSSLLLELDHLINRNNMGQSAWPLAHRMDSRWRYHPQQSLQCLLPTQPAPSRPHRDHSWRHKRRRHRRHANRKHQYSRRAHSRSRLLLRPKPHSSQRASFTLPDRRPCTPILRPHDRKLDGHQPPSRRPSQQSYPPCLRHLRRRLRHSRHSAHCFILEQPHA